MANTPTTFCGDCGTPLDESPQLPVEKRQPCPECGSHKRRFGQPLALEVPFRPAIRWKGKRPGLKDPFVEGRSGWDLHRLTGKWNLLERTIDRAGDWYREHIVDGRTGRVLRHIEEPLSKHRGRGSAKRRRR